MKLEERENRAGPGKPAMSNANDVNGKSSSLLLTTRAWTCT